eukprot:COSAG01_NODE_65039_length_274_cov_0.891429_1_plen_23_part_10
MLHGALSVFQQCLSRFRRCSDLA